MLKRMIFEMKDVLMTKRMIFEMKYVLNDKNLKTFRVKLSMILRHYNVLIIKTNNLPLEEQLLCQQYQYNLHSFVSSETSGWPASNPALSENFKDHDICKRYHKYR